MSLTVENAGLALWLMFIGALLGLALMAWEVMC